MRKDLFVFISPLYSKSNNIHFKSVISLLLLSYKCVCYVYALHIHTQKRPKRSRRRNKNKKLKRIKRNRWSVWKLSVCSNGRNQEKEISRFCIRVKTCAWSFAPFGEMNGNKHLIVFRCCARARLVFSMWFYFVVFLSYERTTLTWMHELEICIRFLFLFLLSSIFI